MHKHVLSHQHCHCLILTHNPGPVQVDPVAAPKLPPLRVRCPPLVESTLLRALPRPRAKRPSSSPALHAFVLCKGSVAVSAVSDSAHAPQPLCQGFHLRLLCSPHRQPARSSQLPPRSRDVPAIQLQLHQAQPSSETLERYGPIPKGRTGAVLARRMGSLRPRRMAAAMATCTSDQRCALWPAQRQQRIVVGKELPSTS